MTIFTKTDPPQLPPSTLYVLSLDGWQREARIQVPNDLADDEAQQLIQAIRDHVTRHRPTP